MPSQDLYPHAVLREINNPYVGSSVSVATLKPEELLPKFVAALKLLIRLNPELDSSSAADRTLKIQEAEEWLELTDAVENGLDTDREDDDVEEESEDEHFEQGDFIFNDLVSYLDAFAPIGYYFGTLDGDGADYGFWILQPDDDSEALNELREQLTVARRQISWVLEQDNYLDSPLNKVGLSQRELLTEVLSHLETVIDG